MKPAAAIVHIPCMLYPPFGKRTNVAVMPVEMSPRIAQPTTATPQRSRRSMRRIVARSPPPLPPSHTETSVVSRGRGAASSGDRDLFRTYVGRRRCRLGALSWTRRCVYELTQGRDLEPTGDMGGQS